MNWRNRWYPPVRAETYRLNAFLFRLAKQDRDLLRQFIADRRVALAESPLTAEEREAVAALDLQRMVELGAHPFLARNLYSTVHRLEHEDEYTYH
jgi:hypothetical protein